MKQTLNSVTISIARTITKDKTGIGKNRQSKVNVNALPNASDDF